MAYKGTFKTHCKNGHVRITHGTGTECEICRPARSRAKYLKNRDRINAERKQWRLNNPEEYKKQRAKYHFLIRETHWRKDGVLNRDNKIFTRHDFNLAFQIQGGMCGGCGLHQSDLKYSLCVDHDHSTGKFRALLCRRCNSILGLCADRRETLLKLAELICRQI